MLHFGQLKRGMMMLNSYEHFHAIELLAQTVQRFTRRKTENLSLNLASRKLNHEHSGSKHDTCADKYEWRENQKAALAANIPPANPAKASTKMFTTDGTAREVAKNAIATKRW